MFWKDVINILRAVLDLAFPRSCIVCGRRLLSHEKHICIFCHSDLPFTYYSARSHNPMSDKLNAMIERDVDASGSEFPEERYSYATALFFYNNSAGFKNITKSLKYHGNIPAGKFFSSILGERIAEAGLFDDVNMVIPVPLHFFRKCSRGYNQSEVIAKVLAEKLKAELVTDVLRRNRNTLSQTRLSVEDKYRNVMRAFSVNTAVLSSHISKCRMRNVRPASKVSEVGIHILLVDDVFTTGATLNACRYALRKSLSDMRLCDCRISVVTLAFVG